MAKMSLAELRSLRQKTKNSMDKRDQEGKDIEVLIGMGTCGIAAGAKQTLEAFLDSIEKKNLSNVKVKQTGCMGLCYVEPTIEVRMADMPATIYGKVDKEVARQIVDEHIMNKKLLNNHIYDRPASDIIGE